MKTQSESSCSVPQGLSRHKSYRDSAVYLWALYLRRTSLEEDKILTFFCQVLRIFQIKVILYAFPFPFPNADVHRPRCPPPTPNVLPRKIINFRAAFPRLLTGSYQSQNKLWSGVKWLEAKTLSGFNENLDLSLDFLDYITIVVA